MVPLGEPQRSVDGDRFQLRLRASHKAARAIGRPIAFEQPLGHATQQAAGREPVDSPIIDDDLDIRGARLRRAKPEEWFVVAEIGADAECHAVPPAGFLPWFAVNGGQIAGRGIDRGQ